ncbi:MAG: T9SS type A sorting domain-containing protein [Chitinophagaceae bacterium]|nr:T9SS type A sorting domain-containing protein [Chitinophagaceae bacterium]
MGGIVVIRRKDNYAPPLINNDQPKGVVILNNTINDLQNIHANDDDAYGIVVGGTNHLIKDNTITNTEVSIQLQKGNDNYDNNNNSDQAHVDFYFSRDNSADVCAYLDNNTITGSGLPRLVTGVATASATLPNNVYNTSTQMAFCTIQDAIDNDFTVDGNIINVGAGIFTEEILLNKNLSLRGANYGINPNTGSRVAETILHPSTSGADPNDVSAVVMIYVEPTGSGSTIDGFTIDGNNPLLTSGILINEGTTDVDAIEAISAYEGLSNFTVTNNIIKNFSYAGMDLYNYYNSAAATTDNVVSNNLFEGIRPTGGYGIGVLIYNNCYTNITNNVMNGVNVGIQTGNFYNADPGNSHSIANNAIESVNRGIWHNMPYSNAATFSISDNTISTHSSATANRGIMISTVQGTATATVTNNTITGAKYGYYLWSNPTSNNITITGGSVNSTNGIVADNFLGYNTNATSSSYIIDGVNITAVDTGIIVRDDVANTNNATVAVTIKGNTTVSNANIGLAIIGSDASASVVTTDPDVVTLSGDIVNTSGTPLNASTGDIALNGTTSNIEGGATIRNLTLNNTTGATIASGVGNTVNILNTYTPTAGVLTTNNNLVLKSTASTTASIAQGNAAGNYIDGSVVVERFVPAKAARKWNFLASPITQSIADGWQQQIHITGAGTGGTVCPTLTPHTNGYDATVSNAPNIYTYDAANASGTRWTKPATTNADFLTAGKAFRVNVRGDRNLGCSLLDGSPSGLVPTAVTLSTTGAINNTNKNAGNFTITFNNAKDDNSTDKYVMIGNPYPSMLSFSALQAANNTTIATNYAIYIPANPASIYSYWDAMTSSFTGGIGYDDSFGDVIASGQSFFVQSLLVNDNFMSLDFAENQKSTTMFNGYFKPRSFNEQIKVNYIQNNNKVDEVIIRYANDAGISNTEVGNMDIPSMNSGTFISSLKESKRMVIQTRDLQTLNNDEVWLNVGATESGFYQLNFSDYENFAGTDIFLIDHYTNATQNIRQNATYSFLIDKDNAATKGSERFSIVFNRTVQEVYVQNLIKMYPNPANKQVTIELPQENNISYTIKITDVAGKVVMQHRTNGGTQQLSIGELMTGTYFVEIIDSKGNRKTEKLIKN